MDNQDSYVDILSSTNNNVPDLDKSSSVDVKKSNYGCNSDIKN